MSDNFDIKVCNRLQSTKNSDNCYYDNIYTTINTLLANYQAMLNFVQSVKRLHCQLKTKHVTKTWLGQSV